MPLIGHAVVGLITGIVTSPPQTAKQKEGSWRSQLWLPALLVLAYVPDILGYILQAVGWQNAKLIGHSIFCALFYALPSAFLLQWLAGQRTFRSTYCLSWLTIVLHDVLDILQSTDRQPFWPLTQTVIGFDINLIPSKPLHEAILFGGLLFCFFVWRSRMSQFVLFAPFQKRERAPVAREWLTKILILLIISAALLTHQLRGMSEKKMHEARRLLSQRKYEALLTSLDKIENRWPPMAKPGRIDYMRGIALWESKDLTKAEYFLLRSYKADPMYFWCVADLALYYAVTVTEQDEKKNLMAPFLQQLKDTFADHPAYNRYIKKIQNNNRRIFSEKF